MVVETAGATMPRPVCAGVASFRPTIPPATRARNPSCAGDSRSPMIVALTSATPIAPIPTHTAYATPVGRLTIALASRKNDPSIAAIVSTLGHSTVNPCVRLSATAQTISSSPAQSSMIHAAIPDPWRGPTAPPGLG